MGVDALSFGEGVGSGFSDSGDRPLRRGLLELNVLCIGVGIERLMIRLGAAARSREELARGAM